MSTPAELVTQLYIGYYDRAPDPVGLQYWIGRLDAGVPLVDVANSFAASPEAQTTYPYFLAPDVLSPNDFLAQVYMNIFGRAIDTGPGSGLEFYGGKLANGESPGAVLLEIIQNAVTNTTPGNTDAAFLANKVAVGLDWAATAADHFEQTYQDDGVTLEAPAMASAHGVIDGVTEDAATVTEGQAETDAFFAAGQTFILTDGADLGLVPGQDYYGTENNDTYIAGTVNSGPFSGNTLGNGDAFDGQAGDDTLKIIDNGVVPLTPQIKNIEHVTAQALGDTTVVMTNAQGVQEIVNDRSFGDLAFEDIQNATAISVMGTNETTLANFHAGADFGDDMHINVNGAGVDGDRAEIFVSTDDTPAALSVDSSGEASFVRVDVDDNPGPGTTVEFETLNITGDADLNLRDNGGEFDHVTTVNVDSTGGVDLNFNDNDEDVTYNGANGSGDDFLRFNNGHDNAIDTGDGDDTVQVWGGGDQTVNLGDGDDSVLFGYSADVNDTADGGAGTDTIGVEAHTLDGLTVNGDFEGQISNFEKVYAWNDIDQGDSATVDLANLDDINYVITDGTEEGESEIQVVHVAFNDATNGGRYLIGGVEIVIDPTDSLDAIGAKIAAAEADIIAANPNITNVSYDAGSDYVRVDYSDTAGDVPQITLVNEMATGANLAAPTEVTVGVKAVDEEQTLSVNTAPTTNGDITVTLDGVAVAVTLVGGETTIETAARIVTAINASAVNATAASTGSVVTVTFDSAEDNVAAPSFADTDGTNAVVAATDGTTDGDAGTAEVQTVVVGSGAANDGVVLVEGVAVALTAGMTVDQVGAAIQAKENEIIAANDDITNVDYNTATDTLTFTYSVDAGDADDVSIIDSSNVDIHYEYTQQTGALGGSMTLDNMQTGGTLELNGGNDGETIVNLATDGANDSFNIILNDGIGSSDGLVHLAGIETLNVSQLDTDQFGHRLGLDAADATTVTVTGEAGVLFNNDFASLTSFDASGVTGTGDMGAVSVVTNADADTSLTGGAGDDSLTGSDQADDSDTINGGAGDDALFGRAGDDNLSGGDGDDDLTGGLGIDNMSGGAGNDTFHFNVVGDSQGVTVDNIADFISGEDTIDLSAIEQGTGSYAGEANGYGAVLTTLSGAATGDSLAVLDTSTSTLYVDVNGDGVLNDFDMAIDITGITNLEASDLAW